MQTAEAWLERHPDDAPAWRRVAQLYSRVGRNRDASEAYVTVLKMDPNDPIALNNLAMLLKDIKPMRALDLAQRAARSAPTSGDVLDTLGALALATGQTPLALDALRRAYDAAPENPTIQLNYARALLAAGHNEPAREILEYLRGRRFDGSDEVERLLGVRR
jgi:Flp pilus assembly protein TadD